MPYEIKVDQLPAGVAAEASRGNGEAEVIYTAFYSTEDGQTFVKHLEGLTNDVLNAVTSQH